MKASTVMKSANVDSVDSVGSVDSAAVEVSTAELPLADWPTEEFAVPFAHPAVLRRRRRVPVAVLAILMLLVGLVAGLGAALAIRGAADSPAAPRTGVSSEPSPTSHDVVGILTAVGATSISVSSGSITSTYQVTPATRITRGTAVVRLQTLRIGEQVTVRLGFADSTSAKLTAQAISVTAISAKATPAKPRSSARATAAPAPVVVAPTPQAVVTASAPVGVPTRGSTGFGSGIGFGFGAGAGVPGGFGGR